MWKYVKTLQYPINIKNKDLKMAKYLVTQYGGSYYKRDIKGGLYELLQIFKKKEVKTILLYNKERNFIFHLSRM